METIKFEIEDSVLAEKVRIQSLASLLESTIVNSCDFLNDLPTKQLQAEMLAVLEDWRSTQIARLIEIQNNA